MGLCLRSLASRLFSAFFFTELTRVSVASVNFAPLSGRDLLSAHMSSLGDDVSRSACVFCEAPRRLYLPCLNSLLKFYPCPRMAASLGLGDGVKARAYEAAANRKKRKGRGNDDPSIRRKGSSGGGEKRKGKNRAKAGEKPRNKARKRRNQANREAEETKQEDYAGAFDKVQRKKKKSKTAPAEGGRAVDDNASGRLTRKQKAALDQEYIENQKNETHWYDLPDAAVHSAPVGGGGKPWRLPRAMAEELEVRGRQALQAAVDKFTEAKLRVQDSAERKWFTTVMTSGTLSDKVAALTLSVQESPVHGLPYLDRLLAMAQKNAAREKSMALEGTLINRT
jgi:hypothetical protein